MTDLPDDSFEDSFISEPAVAETLNVPEKPTQSPLPWPHTADELHDFRQSISTSNTGPTVCSSSESSQPSVSSPATSNAYSTSSTSSMTPTLPALHGSGYSNSRGRYDPKPRIPCPTCPKTFTLLKDLIRHQKRVASCAIEPLQQIECPKCGATLSRPDVLKRHLVNVDKLSEEEAQNIIDAF